MKTFRSIALTAVAAALLFVLQAEAKPGWLTNLKQAQDEAKAKNKWVLVDFTGSDWCGWCIKLDKEVFDKPEFKTYADKNLVLLMVDFPRGKKLSTTQTKHNEELATKYGVQGYPTIVVLDGNGEKLGELGYVEGGPTAFIAELEKLRKTPTAQAN